MPDTFLAESIVQRLSLISPEESERFCRIRTSNYKNAENKLEMVMPQTGQAGLGLEVDNRFSFLEKIFSKSCTLCLIFDLFSANVLVLMTCATEHFSRKM